VNCYYCGKLLGNTDPSVQPNEHPTRRQCAECAVEYSYILEHSQRPLLTLLTKVIRNPVEAPKPPLPESFGTALARMPKNFHLKCSVEQDPDEEHPFLSAVIMEAPPDEGWPTLDAYFGSPGHPNDEDRLNRFRYDEACRVGTSARYDDPQTFEAMIVNMIASRWPRVQP
jgi:hypothetical protein